MQPHNSPHQLVLSHVHITSWTIRILPRSDVSTTCIQVLETTKVMGRQNSSLRMHSGTYVSCRTSTWKREIDSDAWLWTEDESTENLIINSIIPVFLAVMCHVWRALQNYKSVVVVYPGKILQCYFFGVYVYVGILQIKMMSLMGET